MCAGNTVFPKIKIKGSSWGSIWKDCNRPRTGIVADIMHKTKREYHSAVRYLEDALRCTRKAQAVAAGQHRNFWSEANKMKASKAAVAARIDNADAGDIAEHFAHMYRELYSSVPSDPSLILEIKR